MRQITILKRWFESINIEINEHKNEGTQTLIRVFESLNNSVGVNFKGDASVKFLNSAGVTVISA